MAAKYVALSAVSLRAVVKASRLNAVRITPGRVVYLREDLDAFRDKAARKTVAMSKMNG